MPTPAALYLTAWYVSRKKPRGSRCTSGSMTTTPGIAAGTKRMLRLLLEDADQVLAVHARGHGRGEPREIGGGDVAQEERDFLEAGDHQPLPLLDGLNVIGRLHQRFVRAGVEP